MATGAALASGGIFASLGSAGASEDCDCWLPPDDPDEWSTGTGNAANTRYVPSDGFEEPDTIAWTYDPGAYRWTPTVVDGRVYPGPESISNGKIRALDAEDGSLEWVSDDVDAGSPPVLAHGRAYVSSSFHFDSTVITALDASTGDVLWTRPFEDAESISTGTIAYETVFANVDRSIHALDASDGSVRWSRDSVTVETEDEELSPSFGSSAAANGLLYVSLDDGQSIAALDPATGETRWTTHTRRTHGGVTVTPSRIYSTNRLDEAKLAFDAETGAYVGGAASIYSMAAKGDYRVYPSYPKASKLVAVGPSEDGITELWEHSAPGSISSFKTGTPAIVGDTVITTFPVPHPDPDSDLGSDPRDDIVGYDLESGREKWRFSFDEQLWSTRGGHFVVSGDTIYAVRDGVLHAIRPSRDGGGGGGRSGTDDGESGDETEDGDGPDDDGDDRTDGQDGTEDDGDGQNGTEDDGAVGDAQEGDDAEDDGADDSQESDGDDARESDGDDERGVDEGGDEDDPQDAVDEGTGRDDERDSTDDGRGEDDDGGAAGGSDDEDGVADDTDTSSADEGGESDNNTDTDGDTDDGGIEATPGFTTGAGLTGGALGLEWLRRRALDEEAETESGTQTRIQNQTEIESETENETETRE